MNINDIIRETENEELAALSQFFVGRSDDMNAGGEMSVDAFLSMAQNMGININREALQDAVQKGLLEPIADVNDDKIIFKSHATDELTAGGTMTVDQARGQVEKAAKRAADKRKD